MHAAPEATIIATVFSTLLFILAVLVYVGMVYYHDNKRDMYNSSWIFNESDLHFISGGQLNNGTQKYSLTWMHASCLMYIPHIAVNEAILIWRPSRFAKMPT